MRSAKYKVSGTAFSKDPDAEMAIRFSQQEPDLSLPLSVDFAGGMRNEAVPFLMSVMSGDVEIQFDDDLHPIVINGKRTEELFRLPLSILLGLHTGWVSDEILDSPVIS